MEEFFTGGRWAVVGVSRDPDKYGHIVYHRLKREGQEVFAVNPLVDEIDGERCYPSLANLPDGVEQIVIVVPPSSTEQVVAEAVERGIRRIWMQPGAGSKAAVEYCRARGINVVSGPCILLYIDSRRGEAGR
jgi:predicted CoA-binding protein